MKRRGQERDFELRFQLAAQLSDIYRQKKQYADDLLLWNSKATLDAETSGVVSPQVLANVNERLATAKTRAEAEQARH